MQIGCRRYGNGWTGQHRSERRGSRDWKRCRRWTLADKFEKVIIAADGCSLTLMPELGGKIASLRVGEVELLQQPLRPYARRFAAMSFAQSDASGWDECLPTVEACTVETAMGAVALADHGDLWCESWRVLGREPDAVTMSARCRSLPLVLTRSLLLSPRAQGWQLRALYSLENLGPEPVPWSWSAHPLFTCEAGDRIRLPQSVRQLTVEYSRGERLGAAGSWIDWPGGLTLDGQDLDRQSPDGALDRVPDPDCGWAEKLFTGQLAAGDGWCELERARVGLRLRVRFDPAATPYLGLWLCYGGWPEDGQERQRAIALEPTTAPTDALATTGAWSRMLQPGATAYWPMEVEVERLAAMPPEMDA